ncbi:MAG TPA: hypothetical protein VGD79_00410, partial [Thermoanaerobaculia bacterium]
LASTPITIGMPTSIDVRVRNLGSCPLAAGTTYDVCLAWQPPNPASPFPVPIEQRVACRTETIAAGGMAVGGSRTSTFSWTPDAALVAPGPIALVAWVNHAKDPVRSTADAAWDNNRARRDVVLVSPP